MREVGLCLYLVQSYSVERIIGEGGEGAGAGGREAQAGRALLSLCGPSNEDEGLDSTRSFSATTHKRPAITEEAP